MSKESPEMEQWNRRLEEMKLCRSVFELRKNHGEPAHKVTAGEIEIWHYPLGTSKGLFYSVRAAVKDDALEQVYMHMEPVAHPNQTTKVVSWLFGSHGKSKKGKSIESRLVLADRELYNAIQDENPVQRRRAAKALANWVVKRVGLEHPMISEVLTEMSTERPGNSTAASRLEKLAEELDLECFELEEREEAGTASKDQVTAAFSQARAANAVAFALAGDLAEAAYEAIAATDDLTQARRVIVSALSGREKTRESH